MIDNIAELILKRFFNKQFVVERSHSIDNPIQGRFITFDELKDIVQFAYDQGLKHRRKNNHHH